MSWLSENYEKAAMGTAAVAVLAVGGLVWMSQGKIDEDFPASSGGKGNAAAAPAQTQSDAVIKSLESPAALAKGSSGTRQISTFVGLPLFVEEGEEGKVVDLLKAGSRQIHEGIPNDWWVKNGLEIGFDNSPDLDPDGDGFTNRDEYEDKTDPNEATDHPPLYKKLTVQKIEKKPFLLNVNTSGEVKATLRVTLAGARRGVSTTVSPGEVFPSKGAMKGFFRYIGRKEVEEVSPTNGSKTKVWMAEVADTRPNLKGVKYIVRSKKSPKGLDGIKGYRGEDRFAVFTLEAIGEQGKKFTVAVGESFSLPSGGANKEFKVVSIDAADKVSVKVPGLEGLHIPN